MIYLDHAATTAPDARALAAMLECAREAWANPSSAYAAAGAARRVLRQARTTVARLVNAAPEEVLFTSGGTEANNQAATLAAGGHAVVSAIEHHSVLNAVRRMARAVTEVMPDASGRVSPEAVARAIRPDTRLISVQLANNETGVIQPVSEIGALARDKRIPLHCDAVQAFGHVPIDMRAMRVDLVSLSAHKLYGPRGAGALVARQGVPVGPLLSGGGQEFGLRAGTENVPAIRGLDVAAALAGEDLAERAARERALMDGFIEALRARVPGCMPLCADAPRLPGIAAILLPGLSSEQAVADLDLLGVAVSGGAACASRSGVDGRGKASHVYRALGLGERDAGCVIRVSIGRGTTREELERAAEAVARVYARRIGRE